MAEESLESGVALEKMKLFIEGQGGNPAVIDDYSLFAQPAFSAEVTSPEGGFVQKLHARRVGIASQHSGAGRATKEDAVDMAAGLYLHKKVGEPVQEGDLLATVYGNDETRVQAAAAELRSAYVIGDREPEQRDLIRKVIGGRQVAER